jgi:hypothetical protein
LRAHDPVTLSRVRADWWLDERIIADDLLLWEHSIGLPFYDSVLSLLWTKELIDKYSDCDEPEAEEWTPIGLMQPDEEDYTRLSDVDFCETVKSHCLNSSAAKCEAFTLPDR